MMSDNLTPLSPDSKKVPSQDSKGKKTPRLLLTLLGLSCFGVFFYLGGFTSLSNDIHVDYLWLLIAITGTGAMLFIYAVRWRILVNSMVSHRITDNFSFFFYSLSSLAIGLVVPHTVGATVGRAAALHKFENLSWKKSSASVLLDKIFDGFFMLMFSWPFFLLLTGKVSVLQVALISGVEFVVATVLVVTNYPLWIRILQGIISTAVKLLRHIPYIAKKTPLQNIQALHNIKELEVLQRETILQAYFLTAFGQVMLAVRAWLAAMAIGLDMITPLAAFVGIGLVQASVLISITPGGLGFTDTAWFLTLTTAGVPKEITVVFVVAFRLIEMLAIVVWWLPLYYYKVVR